MRGERVDGPTTADGAQTGGHSCGGHHDRLRGVLDARSLGGGGADVPMVRVAVISTATTTDNGRRDRALRVLCITNCPFCQLGAGVRSGAYTAPRRKRGPGRGEPLRRSQ